MEAILQDIRYALRMLLKRPGFTAVAVLTLALGIGANTAIFSVVNSVLLRPLPYKDPDRLVMIWETNPKLQLGVDRIAASAADFVKWREQNHAFEKMAVLAGATFNLTGGGEPERVGGARVSAELFSLMGVEPKMGRLFTNEEDRPGSNHVVLVSDGFWQRRFGSDPNLIGRSLLLDGESYTVVGIMRKGFQFPCSTELPAFWGFPPQTDIWIPIALTQEQINSRGDHPYAVIARLKEDVSMQQAQAEMSTIFRGPEAESSGLDKGINVVLVPLLEQIVGNVRVALLVLLAAVAFVLLISCANVANLLLARSSERKKEIAIRVSLGATRGRVIRQFLTESVLLSLIGGTAGILVNIWGIGALVGLSPGNIPRLDEISTDARVLCFTFGLSLITGVIFGLAPALQASRLNLNESLKEGARGTSGSIAKNRVINLFVVAEVALSLVLLVGAGLLIRSFSRLLNVDTGFNAKNVLTMKISLPETKYAESRQQTIFFEEVLNRIKTLPEIKAAGFVSNIPLSGMDDFGAFVIEGRPYSLEELPIADRRRISGDYFRAMGIPLLKGRLFTERDDENGPGVVIISESFARRFFPDEDPIGKRIMQGDPRSNRPFIPIVGVVGDIKHKALENEARPTLYMPYPQRPIPNMTLLIRTATDPRGIVAAVRNEIWSVDKDLPISDIRLLEEYLTNSVSWRRFNMALLGIFATLALVLAAVGIYGVISYSVTLRTHEIGIRMALGAKRGDVLRLVLGHGIFLASIGIIAGLAGAFAVTRLMSSLLFGVSATDPLTFLSIAMLLLGVAVAASLLPAYRALRVDPIVALRYE